MQKKVLNFFKIIFGISIIVYLILKIDFSYLKQINFISNIEYLIFSVLMFTFSLTVIQAVRLHVLLNDTKITFFDSLKLVLIGSFYSSFLPSNIGGDGFKVIALKNKYKFSLNKSFTLIFIERLSGLTVLFFMGFFYLLFYWKRLINLLENNNIEIGSKVNSILYILSALLFLILIVFLIKPKWFKKIINNIISSYKQIKNISFSIYLKIFFYSIILHLFRLFGFYLMILFFNNNIYWVDLFFMLSATAFISVLPITIGAFGLREGTISVLLILFGVSENEAISIALLNRLILLMLTSVGAYFYAKSDYKEIKITNE